MTSDTPGWRWRAGRVLTAVLVAAAVLAFLALCVQLGSGVADSW
jgi:hypothetical protein